jgi:hypothetical protein
MMPRFTICACRNNASCEKGKTRAITQLSEQAKAEDAQAEVARSEDASIVIDTLRRI